ncbi:Hypothetical protein A7982_08685 [Minicystis rosea]|nr:Hypothetical protein A7982_08685 [Minicystis rosea]
MQPCSHNGLPPPDELDTLVPLLAVAAVLDTSPLDDALTTTTDVFGAPPPPPTPPLPPVPLVPNVTSTLLPHAVKPTAVTTVSKKPKPPKFQRMSKPPRSAVIVRLRCARAQAFSVWSD